jgi:hypothetical protein
MSDFPNGGDVKATRTWLDRKGFEGLFIGWEAEALLGQDRADLLSLAGGENEKSLKLWGYLNFARQSPTPSTCTVLV